MKRAEHSGGGRARLGRSGALWWALLLGCLCGPGCDEGEVRLGPKPPGPRSLDARVFNEADELERLLAGVGPTRTESADEARDLRAFLPSRHIEARVGDLVFAVVPIGLLVGTAVLAPIGSHQAVE